MTEATRKKANNIKYNIGKNEAIIKGIKFLMKKDYLTSQYNGIEEYLTAEIKQADKEIKILKREFNKL